MSGLQGDPHAAEVRITQVDPAKRVHLIVNPHSGYGGQSLLLGDLRAELRRAKYDCVEYTTTRPGDATRYCRGVADRLVNRGVQVWASP